MAKVPWLWWEDRNGDGVIQQAETRETKIKALNPNCVADADLNFYVAECTAISTGSGCRPSRFLPNGVPLYDDASLKQVDYAKDHSCYTYDLAVNPADGSVLMQPGPTSSTWTARRLADHLLEPRRRADLALPAGLPLARHARVPRPQAPASSTVAPATWASPTASRAFPAYSGGFTITTEACRSARLHADGRSGETGPDQSSANGSPANWSSSRTDVGSCWAATRTAACWRSSGSTRCGVSRDA